jgi:endonuclease/exonuclease/phosphatase family metal-dependent hydrolase
MRVLTLNLWGHGGDWPARRSALRAGLEQLRPDLVAFQETIKTADDDQAAELLGPDFHLAHQSVGLGDGAHRLAIGSRWPLVDVHELDLHLTPRTGVFPCATLAVEVEAPDGIGRLLFVNHLPSYELPFELERELQTVAAARFIEEAVARRRVHVIVAGDLDATPSSASIRFWTGRQSLDGMSVSYRDAWESAHAHDPGHTFTPVNPLVPEWAQEIGRRIDYILVRGDAHGPSLRVASCDRTFDRPIDGVWATDHFGVIAELEPAPREREPA